MHQNAYLRRQLGESMKQKRKEIQRLPSSMSSKSTQEGKDGDELYLGGSFGEEEPMRGSRRGRTDQSNLNNIKVEIPEFEGRLDLDAIFQWLRTVESGFECKEIPEDKKAKLVAHKL